MNKIAIASVIGLLLIPVGYNAAFAKTFQVTIPTGAADENAPFFYSPWELSIDVLDKVEWQNGDTAAHTVTSGIVTNGTGLPDGRFDSGLMNVGKSFSYQFMETDAGVVNYFCSIHPWMKGIVNVGLIAGLRVIHNVGSDVGDRTFDVQYTISRSLEFAKVNTTRNSVTFTLSGVIENDSLIIMLPEGLIENPNTVWVDNQQITNFEKDFADGITAMIIPLEADSEEVTIVGSSVVPEFGPITALIFAVDIISTIVFSAKRFGLVPKL
ncbi:MAG: PEFG-CTERM sorting domain-containing protein [Nitrososphaeraceae archaeon]